VWNPLTQVTDDAGNVTTLTYDGLGRKVSMDDPDMGSWSYAYDIWGQLDTQTDARGAQVNFTYDMLGRVTERKARMSVNDSWATVAAYTYDSTTSGNKGIGRLTSSTSPAASDTITYDLLGRVTTTTRTIDSVNYTTSMTYDSLGRVLTTTLPTSEVVTATYNARGLFESMSGTDTYVSSTAYTPTGGIDQQLLGNTVTTTFEYDSPTNRLKRIIASKIPANPLIDLTYTYDAGGNITQIVDASWVNGASRNETTTYGYDFLNRLLSADVVTTGTSTYLDQRDYAYNPIGNMTSFTLNNGTPTTYAYPTSGSSSVQPHAVSSRDIPATSNDDSFEYDANGNMTERVQGGVTWTQVFDAENRLVSVSDGTTTTQYVYDGSGGRVKRIVGNTTTTYVAGMEIEKVSGAETQRTIYYPAGGAFRVIGGANAGLYFRHSDHLGSTSVLSDSTGAKVAGSDVVYAPFGEVRTGTESDLSDFGYTGQRHDDNTGGLMYYGARYYLPGVMRFISADTIVPSMANPQALNRFSYSYNNPINFVDPTGHSGDEWWSTSDMLTELSWYGVSMSFEEGETFTAAEIREAILVTMDAVQTLAESTQEAIAEIEQNREEQGLEPLTEKPLTDAGAFKTIFGPTHLNVIRDAMCHDPCKKGEEEYYYGFNERGTTNGVNVIEMYIGGFTDAGDAKSGPTWVAHEIGHNLEEDYGGDGNFGPPELGLGSAPIRELISPQSGGWSGSTGELTPDIIAAWAFDDYNYAKHSGLASAFRDDANTWMSGVIGGKLLQVSSTP